MKLVKLLLIASGIFLFCFSIQAQEKYSTEVDKIAKQYVKKKKNQGLVIGIIQNGTSTIKGYGQLSKEDTRTPDENTLFEIGSVTSTFTTTLMMLESQEGQFQLQDPVRDFLPSDVKLPSYTPFICREVPSNKRIVTDDKYDFNPIVCEPDPYKPETCISFCDLATHTSGLSNAPKGLYSWNPIQIIKQRKDPYKDYSKEELYKNLRRNQLVKAPGIYYFYSNSGIAVLGNVLADLNKTSYETLLKDKLLMPLQMENTQIELKEEQKNQFAIGHTKTGKVTPHWHFNSMAPAGGLSSSASDLVKFIKANLNSSDKVLSNAFEQVQQSRIDAPKSKLNRSTTIGYGWHISILNEASNQPLIWMNGGTGGFRSFVGFIKDTNTGIVILSNSANSVDEMAIEIMELLTPATNKNSIGAVDNK